MEGNPAGSGRRRSREGTQTDRARIVCQHGKQPVRCQRRDVPRIKRVCGRRSEFLDANDNTSRKARGEERNGYSSGGSKQSQSNRAENSGNVAQSINSGGRGLDRSSGAKPLRPAAAFPFS